MILIAIALKENIVRQKRSIDYIGTLTLTVGVVALALRAAPGWSELGLAFVAKPGTVRDVGRMPGALLRPGEARA